MAFLFLQEVLAGQYFMEKDVTQLDEIAEKQNEISLYKFTLPRMGSFFSRIE